MPGQTLSSLHDLFIVELNDITDAEEQIVDAMPKMIDAASAQELKDKFQQHLEQTRNQIDRLSQVFEYLGVQPNAERCEGMAGLIREGQKLLQMQGEPSVLDAGLIGAAQKIEHYEISAYGTLRTYARMLGYDEVSRLLQQTLREESYTDETLTRVAERSVNKKSA
jgi:ferritin-like metal-binding protein YciE